MALPSPTARRRAPERPARAPERTSSWHQPSDPRGVRGSVDDGGPRCNYGVTREGPFIVLSRLHGDWDAMAGALSRPLQVPDLVSAAVWSAHDYALLVRAPSGEILRVTLNDQERSLRGGDLKGVAVDVARTALKSLTR